MSVLLSIAKYVLPKKMLKRLKIVKTADLHEIVNHKNLLTHYGGELKWEESTLREHLEKYPLQ